MSLFDALFQAIQSIGVILIVAGLFTAFLAKIGFYIHLFLNVLITLALTFLVNKVTGDLGTTFFVLVFGLGLSLVIAAMGFLLALLEGFALSTVGFWSLFAAGSPSNPFSAGMIFASFFLSILATLFAAFLGGKIFSLPSSRKKSKRQIAYRRPTPKYVNNRSAPKSNIATRSYNVVQSYIKPVSHKTTGTRKVASSDFTQNYSTTNLQQMVDRRKKLKGQLRALDSKSSKGLINNATAEKLKKEIDSELKVINNRIVEIFENEEKVVESRIEGLSEQIGSLEKENNVIPKLIDELNARYSIRNISKGEYKRKKSSYDGRVKENLKATRRNQQEIEKLNVRLQKIRKALHK